MDLFTVILFHITQMGEVSIAGELEQSKYQGEWNYYDDDGSLNKTINYDDEESQ